MELKQNNITSNYFSEEYLMNTVSRFWKNFVAEEISYGNAIAAAPGNVAVAIPASGKRNYIWCSGKYFMTRRSCSRCTMR